MFHVTYVSKNLIYFAIHIIISSLSWVEKHIELAFKNNLTRTSKNQKNIEQNLLLHCCDLVGLSETKNIDVRSEHARDVIYMSLNKARRRKIANFTSQKYTVLRYCNMYKNYVWKTNSQVTTCIVSWEKKSANIKTS